MLLIGVGVLFEGSFLYLFFYVCNYIIFFIINFNLFVFVRDIRGETPIYLFQFMLRFEWGFIFEY